MYGITTNGPAKGTPDRAQAIMEFENVAAFRGELDQLAAWRVPPSTLAGDRSRHRGPWQLRSPEIHRAIDANRKHDRRRWRDGSRLIARTIARDWSRHRARSQVRSREFRRGIASDGNRDRSAFIERSGLVAWRIARDRPRDRVRSHERLRRIHRRIETDRKNDRERSVDGHIPIASTIAVDRRKHPPSSPSQPSRVAQKIANDRSCDGRGSQWKSRRMPRRWKGRGRAEDARFHSQRSPPRLERPRGSRPHLST